MKKQEFVDAIAAKAEMSKAEAGQYLESVLEVIREALVSGDEVNITGFGKFGVSERAARTGQNPRTGEKLQIPARTVPTFKAGKELKDAVDSAA